MTFPIWALVIGVLLISMALAGTSLKRLPISTSMLYLAAGFALGPVGLGLLSPDPLQHAVILERAAEVAVLISLFSVGLKLGPPLGHRDWRLPVRLALVSMTVTVALVAAIGVFVLGLSPGAAILLGAIVAPTDPVLASDVQVSEASDRDRLRISLSAEGGLNDGTAFPFVMLGLGLLGLHDLGTAGWRWVAVDVLWAISGGLLIGGTLGTWTGKLVLFLRTRYKASVGFDEFIALGLIALSYGIAVLGHSYGFLAVFAAGFALQRVTKSPRQVHNDPVVATATQPKESQVALATDSEYASVYMVQAVQGFNEQLERVAEVVIVLITGAMLSFAYFTSGAGWLVALLLLVIRPLSVWIGLLRLTVPRDQRILISWFGIRGIGSIYYLMYAINHGLPRGPAEEIIGITLTLIAVSIVLHGTSVTPLMNLYSRRRERQRMG